MVRSNLFEGENSISYKIEINNVSERVTKDTSVLSEKKISSKYSCNASYMSSLLTCDMQSTDLTSIDI